MKTKFHKLSKIPGKSLTTLLVVIGVLSIGNVFASGPGSIDRNGHRWQKDTLSSKKGIVDSLKQRASVGEISLLDKRMKSFERNDTVDVEMVKRSPFISVQQLLKGNVSGVYVQENNGEPGSIQSMLIRGLSSPIFSGKDISGVQPIVYLNGIPIIQDHPFVYDIQQDETNPIGSANNILAAVDINNIESIEVIKDPLRLAKLGPLAANGAIWIVTKNGYQGGEHIHINASVGVATPPSNIKQTNAADEKAFRQQFYDAYSIPVSERRYPAFLADKRDQNYFGESDWADSYYRIAPQYNINASIGGGTPVANYYFTIGTTQNGGVADQVGYAKYNTAFFVNMAILKGFTVSCMLSGTRAERDRNRNFRDRYAETEYFPDLSTPIAPANGAYDRFMDLYSGYDDDNVNNVLNGYLGINIIKNNFYFDAKIMLDYNANVRHVFWPSTIMESVSFVSDYSGYNRRVLGNGIAGYQLDVHDNHRFEFQLLGSIQSDVHHYNYIRAYDGDNDTDKTSGRGNYTLYRFIDKEPSKLVSGGAAIYYNYDELFDLGVVLRTDGHSNVQTDHRWLFTPAFNLGWNLKNQFLKESSKVSNLYISASWARVGKLTESDRFALGPQYTSQELNWEGESVLSSFNGFPSISRAYSYGWIGYDLGWPYAEKLNIELSGSLFNQRLNFALSYYNNNDKDMVVRIPAPHEFGYEYQFLSGMNVNNRGVDLSLSGTIIKNQQGFGWDAALNLNYNRNELKKLPGGFAETVVGDRKLKVGNAIDQFWVYQNQGIYTENNQVPAVNGKVLSSGGVQLGGGDPRWNDVNGDNVINDKDKVLKGHMLPPVTGGFESRFTYRNFDLNFHFFFALGHKALNYRSHQRYDFATLDRQNSLEAVREIFFWQNTNDKNSYPIYNPQSEVHPYRADQDLFLEKLSYLKLRSVSIGYTFTKPNLYLYLTGNNLFTVTKFSGDDPELVDFNGYYRGYGLPIPRTVSLGLKVKF